MGERMKRLFRSTASKISALIVGLAGGLCFLGWRAIQPKIRTASLAEIRAVLPPELAEELPPVDVAAVDRFNKIHALAKSLDATDTSRMVDPVLSKSARSAITRRLWKSHPQLLPDLTSLLGAGPIQSPRTEHSDQFQINLDLVALIRLLSVSATDNAVRGDFQMGIQMLRLGVQLTDRIFASSDTTIAYLTAILLDGIASGAIEAVVTTTKFPASACRQILLDLPPSPLSDECLALSFKRDFQQIYLRRLPDPRTPAAMDIEGIPLNEQPQHRDAMIGNYDALETARVLGATEKIKIDNAKRPLSHFDNSAEMVLKSEEESFPTKPDTEKSTLLSKIQDKLYRLEMNLTRNSMGGKLFFHSGMAGTLPITLSDQWRSHRDMVRVMLAAHIYRASHGGKLPDTTIGFVPILGKWPLDPFNGKPMLYNPKREIAYCVGPGLTDDGGLVVDPRSGTTVGISLKK